MCSRDLASRLCIPTMSSPNLSKFSSPSTVTAVVRLSPPAGRFHVVEDDSLRRSSRSIRDRQRFHDAIGGLGEQFDNSDIARCLGVCLVDVLELGLLEYASAGRFFLIPLSFNFTSTVRLRLDALSGSGFRDAVHRILLFASCQNFRILLNSCKFCDVLS